jgi:predicted proteasome-type protease
MAIPGSEDASPSAVSVQKMVIREVRRQEGADFRWSWGVELCFLEADDMGVSRMARIRDDDTFFIIIQPTNIP